MAVRKCNLMKSCHKVIYDSNYIEAVLEETGNEPVFIIASKTLDMSSTVVLDLENALVRRNCFAGKFTGIEAHSTDKSCIQAADHLQKSGSKILVTIGGGSITDAAKGIRMCMTHTLKTPQDFQQFQTPPNFFSALDIGFMSDLKVINIPTTLSAGEFNNIAGIKDTQKGRKFGYIHDYLVPDVVILDPEVAEYTPENLWISYGIRALDHCIETISSPMSNILANTLCIKGIQMLLKSLPSCFSKDKAERLQAKRDCQLAAWLSMTGISQDIIPGGSHGIGHAIGAFGILHGYTSCLMAPHVLKYNWAVMTAEMQQDIREAFNGSSTEEPHKQLFNFIRSLKMPQSLKEVGLDRDCIPELVKIAILNIFTQSNLRNLNGETIEIMLNSIYETPENLMNES